MRSLLFLFLAIGANLVPGAPPACVLASAQENAATQLYVTMHTAPIDNYCAPCMASEKLLRDAQLQFRKVLEPEGPWPWFTLTDGQGNQRRLDGGLTEADIEKIRSGVFPQH